MKTSRKNLKTLIDAEIPEAVRAHSEATRAGAFVAGTASAAIGATVAGPLGAVAGGIIGALLGGIGGNALEQNLDAGIDVELQEMYWREHHPEQSYGNYPGAFEDYLPGYRVGIYGYEEHAANHPSFEEVEPELRDNYVNMAETDPPLPWEQARLAAQAAWLRLAQHAQHAKKAKSSTKPATQ